ncbi:glycoside hydrolase family 47 protein [Zopfia rhizophila CBS 207.26]|uniref:alpha-1,2-Mannosidase n=1 Tax=Zopfia rhizophila CBS 207.26 TaxID=1314779 RepID=A0A6A6DY57_9PEZI|nr:glycoside hydrolase family 47 protein [Zopfia rhizophila CBS 207.26]
MFSNRRKRLAVILSLVLIFVLYLQWPAAQDARLSWARPSPALPQENLEDGKFHWSKVPQQYQVTSFRSVPKPFRSKIPKIQHAFPAESAKSRAIRLSRLQAVKGNFTHAFKGYAEHSWLHDEVAPLSGNSLDPFGGWAATLVDSLDTLWMMGMHEEFERAIHSLDKIDFNTCSLEEINVFETTIRYLGGFLAAYDLSGGKYSALLHKATEIGDMLYKAFDTPNRMPITRWNFKDAAGGAIQTAPEVILVAEIGSMTLEFTRLSQLSGNPKYFDAVQRIMDVFYEQQNRTKVPGLWPVVVNARDLDFTGHGGFTIGGMADSAFEYLPKQYLLLGGAMEQYHELYDGALKAMKRNIFYRPTTPTQADILFPGVVDSDGKTPVDELVTEGKAEHLGCFAGGMVALAAKVFNNPADLLTAKKLVEGCLWAYESMHQGIMPEIMHLLPCEDPSNCPWDEAKWHDAVNASYEEWLPTPVRVENERLLPGLIKIDDRRYILRPEAIESVFILYRITGDPALPDRAWRMFNSIVANSLTDIAHAALDDITVPNPPKADSMESFWMAETLKYFYLIFSEPDLVSLDEYVFNTEAHPLRRPTTSWW